MESKEEKFERLKREGLIKKEAILENEEGEFFVDIEMVNLPKDINLGLKGDDCMYFHRIVLYL